MVSLRTFYVFGAIILALSGGYLFYTATVPAHYKTNLNSSSSISRQKTETEFWVSPGKEVVVSYPSQPPQPFYVWVNDQKAQASQIGEAFVATLKPTLQEPAKIALELHPNAVVKTVTRSIKKGKQTTTETAESANVNVTVRTFIPKRWSWRRILVGLICFGGCVAFIYGLVKLPAPSSTALVRYQPPPDEQAGPRLNSMQQWGFRLILTGLAGILTVIITTSLSANNKQETSPIVTTRIATPIPATPIPTPYQNTASLIVIPPTPIPVVGPAWESGPPRPTWFINYGNIRFKEEVRFYTGYQTCASCDFTRVYAAQFPSDTPAIYFTCPYEKESQDILQVPVLVTWKYNGQVRNRDQVEWKFDKKAAEFGRGLVGGNLPKGHYQLDCYWNTNWVATGSFEVY